MSQELFDIYDEHDQKIGTAPRNEVHAKGYLHHSFHCWIARDTPEGRKILFQKRQDTKDTFPGLFDITAAGHLSAGETVEDAVREVEEELGIPVRMDQLTSLGTIDYYATGTAGGQAFIDREKCFVFGYLLNLPLTAFRLQKEEVAGLYETDLDDAIALFERRVSAIKASGILSAQDERDSAQIFDTTLILQQFVPHKSDDYLHVFKELKKL
ncbi:NUDIX domain-containing protein [Paenibacillus chibensis]|uniref:NUDIX domain-containing protein n=1 Tax=Paenibacillus chibensis TaxID=59846 RepID=A0ABU6PQ12_9BACL|nr:NUDIX domain-containing protein [Paenibacillus chibensis]MEC0373384.1 NUDIX domain-containing protein [Paenibacillus chibensis]MED5016218.1 NUDIX domain-containing protein [Paenibacillus chibensis]